MKESSLATRLLAQREQEARPQPRPRDGRGELLGERPGPVLVPVVEEVLVDLVEEHVDVAADDRRAGVERVRQRRAGSIPAASASARLRRSTGSDCQASKTTTTSGSRRAAQVVRDPGAEQRALADPALPVQDGQPGRDQVGGDDLAVALAAEEERGVGVRVLEAGEALERVGCAAHAGSVASAASLRPSSAAYSSGATSNTSIAEPPPGRELGRIDAGLDRPRVVARALAPPQAVQEHAHVPLA